MAGGDDKSDDVRDEFLAEAQEIVEALSRDLLVLDQGQKDGHPDPDLVNEVFRGVHTLKGIAGMFGYHQVGAVAHALEDLLDDLRLGRVDLSQDVLDVLFEGVENFQRLLGEASGDKVDFDLSAYAQAIDRVAGGRKPAGNPLEAYDIDPGVLAVLTEYEEHRLQDERRARSAALPIAGALLPGVHRHRPRGPQGSRKAGRGDHHVPALDGRDRR